MRYGSTAKVLAKCKAMYSGHRAWFRLFNHPVVQAYSSGGVFYPDRVRIPISKQATAYGVLGQCSLLLPHPYGASLMMVPALPEQNLWRCWTLAHDSKGWSQRAMHHMECLQAQRQLHSFMNGSNRCNTPPRSATDESMMART